MRKLYFRYVLTILVLGTMAVWALAGRDPKRARALHRLETVFNTILDRYVAEIDPEKLADAISEQALKQLDPYSLYLAAGKEHRIDAVTRGSYGGIGIHLGREADTLVILSPVLGGPAEEMGLRAGDLIMKIDSLNAIGMSLKKASEHIRGPLHTFVKLTIKHPGIPGTTVYRIERRLIRVEDVPYAGFVEPGIGYVKLTSFARNSAYHLAREIRKLQQNGLQGLILDLRGNPGGLLQAALDVADMFVPAGTLLLSTRGRGMTANRSFFARDTIVVPVDLPLAVLIDRGSASASEIVAGILQDEDRAVIIGHMSFGKGLVQSIFHVDRKNRVKITTAKYYLPSGRLIQKQRYAQKLLLEDTLKAHKNGFYSRNGRPLHGGGGIKPDLTVSSLQSDKWMRRLQRKRLFLRFASEYVNGHKGELFLPKEVSDSLVKAFETWLFSIGEPPEDELEQAVRKARGLAIRDRVPEVRDLLDETYRRLQHRDNLSFRLHWEEIRHQLKVEISRVLGGTAARIGASLEYDPVVTRAVRLLKDPRQVRRLLAAAED